jgi:hypothetical protein
VQSLGRLKVYRVFSFLSLVLNGGIVPHGYILSQATLCLTRGHRVVTGLLIGVGKNGKGGRGVGPDSEVEFYSYRDWLRICMFCFLLCCCRTRLCLLETMWRSGVVALHNRMLAYSTVVGLMG